jgi:hypothetical protein
MSKHIRVNIDGSLVNVNVPKGYIKSSWWMIKNENDLYDMAWICRERSMVSPMTEFHVYEPTEQCIQFLCVAICIYDQPKVILYCENEDFEIISRSRHWRELQKLSSHIQFNLYFCIESYNMEGLMYAINRTTVSHVTVDIYESNTETEFRSVVRDITVIGGARIIIDNDVNVNDPLMIKNSSYVKGDYIARYIPYVTQRNCSIGCDRTEHILNSLCLQGYYSFEDDPREEGYSCLTYTRSHAIMLLKPYFFDIDIKFNNL